MAPIHMDRHTMIWTFCGKINYDQFRSALLRFLYIRQSKISIDTDFVLKL